MSHPEPNPPEKGLPCISSNVFRSGGDVGAQTENFFQNSSTLNILDFGAVPDGATLCTAAIQAALDAARDAGGSHVFVPPGRFLTGSVFVHSHTVLELDHNATLVASPHIEDYAFVHWGHHNDRTPWHLINILDATRVVLCGSGTIEGSGPAFWKPERGHDEEFWRENIRRPSPMVEISRCQDVTVRDLRLQNPAGWCLHFHDCKRVRATGLTILNNLLGPNTDGIDITGGQDILISDCHIISGDDGIALKTTRDSGPCENITVTNCVIETNCLGIRIGYESRQDFRHCTFSNLVIKNSSRGIDIRAIEGSTIEHISFSNISIRTNSGWPLDRPIQIYVDSVPDAYPIDPIHADAGKKFPVERAGAVRHLFFNNIDVLTCGRVLIGAVPGLEVKDIRFTNLRLRYYLLDEPGPLASRAQTLSFAPGLPAHRVAPAAICIEGAADVSFDGLSIQWPEYPAPDWAKILTSRNRSLNREVYEGVEEARRTGDIRPKWHAVWARKAPGLDLGNTRLHASEEGQPATDIAP